MRTALRVMAIGIGVSFASAALAHPILHFDLNTIFSDDAATPTSTPMATFANLAGGGGVQLTISGMAGAEFLDEIAFNYAGTAPLTFAHQGGAIVAAPPPTGTNPTLSPNSITVGPVGEGGGGFDILFDYPQPNATRFSGNNFANSVYNITGAGVDETDFNVTNAAGFFAAAHIQGIGPDAGGSAFVAAIPEAETYAMLIAGLGLLGFVMSRRRKSVTPAV